MTSADFSALTSAISNLSAAIAASGSGGGGRGAGAGRGSEIATRSLTSEIKNLNKTFASIGNKLEKFTNSLNKTQKDFGISIAASAKLQANAFKASIDSFIKSFKSINFNQIFSGLKDMLSIAGDTAMSAGKALLSMDFAGAKGAVGSGVDRIIERLTQTLPGKAPVQPVSAEEIISATKAYQDEFGIINRQMGEQLATEAKNRGLSVEQLVQARRAFATVALGDLSKVDQIQTRFFDQFKAKGMTPKIALEAITKYAELIARNGTRFADSFARAAADAKKIGVDLSKVDQIGDNIIDNFEGFLEGQAELGAMGFNFDSSRLAELAESGDTGALFTELRSQLAMTGKDITKLRRSERLALENAFGINISDMLKMAGDTPESKTTEEYAEEGNSLLAQLLVLLAVTGPVFSMLSSGLSVVASAIETGLGMTGSISKLLLRLLTTLAGPLAIGAMLYGIYKIFKAGNEKEDAARRTMENLAGHQGGKLTNQQIKELTAEYSDAAGKRGAAAAAATGGAIAAIIGTRFGISPTVSAPIGAAISAPIGYGFGYLQGDSNFEKDYFQLQERNRLIDSWANRQVTNERRAEAGVPEASFIDRLLATGKGIPKTHMPAYLGGSYHVDSDKQVRDYIKNLPGHAEGGPIKGPGTSTSDSIPARLSNGEYVMNAKAVSNIGVDNLNRLNNVGGKGLGKAVDVVDTISSVNSKIGTAVSLLQDVSNSRIVTAADSGGAHVNSLLLLDKILRGQWKAVAEDLGLQNAQSIITSALEMGGSEALIVGLGLSDTYNAYKEQSKMPWNQGKNPAFYTGYDMGREEPTWVKNSRERGKAMPRRQSSEWSKAFARGVGMRDGGLVGSVKSNLMNRGLGFASKQIPGLSTYMPQAGSLYSSYKQGGVGGLKSNLLGTAGSFLSGKVPGLSSSIGAFTQGGVGGLKSNLLGTAGSFLSGKVPGLSSSIGAFTQGGVGGLKSNLLGTAGSFLSGKVPGLSSSIGAFTQGGVGGLKSSLLTQGVGMLGKKIPGLSGAMNAFSAFKEGGVKGALGSLAKGGIGKAIGGAIGTAIPIPGVGTMIGSMLGSKIGKFAGGLFGKKKSAAVPMGMEAAPSPDLSMMMGPQQSAQQSVGPQQPPVVDTRGIEQKLNNFIAALQNVQINMDGTKVGKLLVNTSDAAAISGPFRAQSR